MLLRCLALFAALVIMLGGLLFMAAALAPSARPDIMTENMRGVLMLLGMGLLVVPSMVLARLME